MMLSGPAAANRRPSAGGVGSAAEITQEHVTALEAQVVTLQAQLGENANIRRFTKTACRLCLVCFHFSFYVLICILFSLF